MLRQFIRNNIPLVSIVIFIILFSLVQLYKPLFLYNQDGSIRSFGIGYKNKTIVPVWLFSIILGIFCYLFVLYYLAYPKISF
jgi:membrane-associated protease RseP (regulator of RpoE activity)